MPQTNERTVDIIQNVNAAYLIPFRSGFVAEAMQRLPAIMKTIPVHIPEEMSDNQKLGDENNEMIPIINVNIPRKSCTYPANRKNFCQIVKINKFTNK